MKSSELHPTAADLGDDDGRSAYQPGRNPRRRETPAQRAAARERTRRYRARIVACRSCGTPVYNGGTRLCIVCGKAAQRRVREAKQTRRQLRELFQGGGSQEHERRVRRLHAEQRRLPL